MKNQQNILNNYQENKIQLKQTDLLITPFLIKNQYSKANSITCRRHNKVTKFCINLKCKTYHAFLCNDNKCACRKDHQNCSTNPILNILKQIDMKIKQSVELKNQIQKIFTKIINEVSQIQEDCKKYVDQYYKYTYLTQDQIKFYQIFHNQGQQFYFTGQKLAELIKNIQKSNKSKNFEENQTQFGSKPFQIFYNQILDYQSKLVSMNESLKNKIKQILLQQQKSRKKIPIINYINTDIIQTKQQLNQLIKYFEPNKQVKSFKVLYKAKQQGFQIKKFFQLYGQTQNTIILAKSQNQKIYGGYTWLKHNYTGQYKNGILKWQQVPDEFNLSFLFSISNDQHFPIKQSKPAIVRYLDKSKIQFGQQQIVIGNNANTQLNNMTWNICTSKSCYKYKQNYHQNDQIKYKRKMFCGHQDDRIKLKAWQCWQVRFY